MNMSQPLAVPLVKFIVFAVVTTFLTMVLATTITNAGFGRTNTYKAEFTDVTGVLPGQEIRVGGVVVGKVKSVKVKSDTVAEVEFSAEREFELPENTHVTIRYRNLLGERYLALARGKGAAPTLKNGGLIPVSQTQSALDLTVLLNGFKPLFAALSPEDINKLSFEIIRTLQGEGGTINSLLGHAASLTTTVAERDQVIGQVIDNLNKVLATVSTRDEEFSDLIVQLQRLISGLAADKEAIGASLVNMAELTDATGDLLAGARPPLKQDIAELSQLAATINQHNKTIQESLDRLPGKLNKLTRLVSYGSWFNFYFCDFVGTITMPDGTKHYIPHVKVDLPRCTQ